mgnify:CR=1 FL=1
MIYCNAIGFFQLFVNGQRIGDDEFSPHVSELGRRTLYLAYDIAPYLKKGTNAICFRMGRGWSTAALRRGCDVRTVDKGAHPADAQGLARQHGLIDGGDLVRQRLHVGRVDRHHGIEQVREVDPVSLGGELEVGPIRVEAPRTPH